MNTNARSLRPKISSFIDNFHELDCMFGFVTETWFSDGSRLELEAENLLLGSGISIFTLNRPINNAGFSHGGVAIVARDRSTKLKVFPFPNPNGFEVLAVVGTFAGVLRPLVLVVVYIPPGYDVPRGKACIQHVCDLLQDAKRKYKDALICVGGDFNQWKIEEAVLDFPDISEIVTPPTRNDRRIDRLFVNWSENIVDKTCMLPLEAENAAGQRTAVSDHRLQFVASVLQKKEAVKWEKFTYRPFNPAAVGPFVEEMKNKSWEQVYGAIGSEEKAAALQSVIDDMMSRHFPLKTVKRKSDDLPWLNDVAKKKIARKKAVFKDENRSERWKALRNDLDEYLAVRKEKFLQKQRDNLTSPDAARQFHKNVKAYKAHDRPAAFNVRDLRPGVPDREVADEVADYFNQISREFQPLQPEDVPSTYHRPIPFLTAANVEEMLRKCNKTSSMVKGDLFPKLILPCAEYLSCPLADIYNAILATFHWPPAWKREYVTTIPKKKLPSDLSDLRNISCTLLFSKVFEGYVLRAAMEEITLKNNQFGGVKGCSTTHALIEIMQEICSNAEDYRAATVISTIDYSKAFNRVSYQHCLSAFAKKNASTPIIKLIATFLSDRTMSVRVGDEWSAPREVTGGCPQGSILGVFLFNVTTEDLEEKFEKFERERLGVDAELLDGRGRPHPVDQQDGAVERGVSLAPQAELLDGRPDPRPVDGSQRPPLSPIGGGIFRMAGARHVRMLNNVRNIGHSFIYPPTETRVGTQVLIMKPVRIIKYVDDNITCEKLNFGNEPVLRDAFLRKIKKKQAISTQNAFASITTAAQDKGMKVNESKTNLLCVSDSLNFKTLAFIKDSDGNVIECKEKLKILGFHLSDRTGVAYHVEEIAKKVRQKYWVLYHLRNLGFTEEELVRVYRCNILPILDYCCPVYHSLLTDMQDQWLERAQIGALRCIYGYGLSARKLREKAQIQTLRKRRIELTDKFARKCLSSERFKCWFPLRTGRISARSQEKYVEERAKCDRLKNSPIFYMRRRLNGKEGKAYGERNREYRE